MEYRDLPIENFRFVGDRIDDIEICFDGIWLKKKFTAYSNDNKSTLFVFAPIDPTEPGAEKYLEQVVALPVETIKTLYSIKDKFMDNYAELVNEGVGLAAEGETQKAIKNFNKAISIDASRAEAYANLANAYDELGDFENAIIVFEKVIEIDASNPNHYFNLGVIYNNFRNNSVKNIFDLEQPIGQVSDNEENSVACFLMAAYFGDNQAIELLQSKGIDSSTKQRIITELLSIANKKLDWCFYRSARKVFKFVLVIDKSNGWALKSIKLCDSEIDN